MTKKTLKVMMCFAIISFFGMKMKAQMSGTYTVPSATYPSIGAIINALNTTTAITGPVTINVSTNYTETATPGGYELTATGTSTSPIIFQKSGSGANPLIIANTGVATPTSTVQDGIWALSGSDYITIDGIDLLDTNSINPATMEYGYGFFKASVTDGCQNNTLKNCHITLNRVNNAAGSGPAAEGSRGIDCVNAIKNAHTTNVAPTQVSGSNSNNKFYSNTVENCNIGISLLGATGAYADQNNDIGGSSAATGNTIINYGGAASASVMASGIKTLAQNDLNVSYNVVNSNNGSGVNHPNVLKGIYVNTASNANTSITNNTVTIKGGGSTTSHSISAIENASGGGGTTNTVSITNNLITNCEFPTVTTGWFYGIYNTSAGNAGVVSISSNTLSGNATNATSGNYYNINSSASAGTISFSNNLVNLGTFNASSSAVIYGVYNGGGISTTTLSVVSNTFQNVITTGTANLTGALNFMYNGASAALSSVTMSSNIIRNIVHKNSGSTNHYMMYNSNGTPNCTITNNAIVGGYTKTATGSNTIYGYYYNNASASGGTVVISGNDFSNVSFTGTVTSYYAIYQSGAPTQLTKVMSNTITNVSSCGLFQGIFLNYGGAGSVCSNNLISNISSNNTSHGLNIGSTNGSADLSVFSNTVSAINLTGPYTVNGLSYAFGTSTKVYNNKFYDLQVYNTSGSVVGINLKPSTLNSTVNVYNNFVGDLRAPITNTTSPAITGISTTSVSAASASITSVNIFYNTIYINATSTGADFATTGIFQYDYSSAAKNHLTLRNNIVINNSIPNGTGWVIAFKRSGNTLGNYDAASNNNIFYAGTPGFSNLVYSDGTNIFQTISQMQTGLGGRESNSATENTAFLSTSGTSANFLHIDPAVTSLAENGAINIAGITDDYDGDIRFGNTGYTGTGTAPDIGADEYNNVLPCSAANAGTQSITTYSSCAGQTVALNSNGFSTGSGISYQWQVGTTPGGPYSNVAGGAGTTSYTSVTLPAGTYYYVLLTTCAVSSVTGVSNEATVTVNPNPTLTPTSSSTMMCSGSSATLTANGATSYTWSSGAMTASIVEIPTATTVYTVTGETLGCIGTETISLTVNSNPTVTASASTPSVCSGNTTTLTASGATSYTWSSGAMTASTVETPTSTTVYTVTGETLGCVGTETISLTVSSTPTVTASTPVINLCAGGNATLVASGATSYTWSSGAMTATTVETPTVNTSYTVTGETGGCTDTATISLIVNPSPAVTAVSSSTMICIGQSATLTASGANTYTWSTGTTAATTVESPTTTVSYTVTGEDVNGCTADFIISQSVSPCTGIESVKGTIASVHVYPNPNNGQLNIVVPDMENNVVFELYDALGKTVAVITLTGNHTKVNIADVAVGIYSYRIVSKNLIYSYGKLVRE